MTAQTRSDAARLLSTVVLFLPTVLPVELQIENSTIYATALTRQVIEDVRLTGVAQLFGFRAEDFNC